MGVMEYLGGGRCLAIVADRYKARLAGRQTRRKNHRCNRNIMVFGFVFCVVFFSCFVACVLSARA